MQKETELKKNLSDGQSKNLNVVDFLENIIPLKRKEVEERKSRLRLSFQNCTKTNFGLLNALSGEGLKIIAEIKKASPSSGIIKDKMDILKLADSYERGGACAISVLTEKNFFNGEIDDLRKVSGSINIPVLRKDFIIDEYQILEARFYGASSFLLISEILEMSVVSDFLSLGRELGMEPVVESFTPDGMEKSIECGAKIIGINNRNLRTLEVDLRNTEKLLRYAKNDKLVISESGIKRVEDIKYLVSLGVSRFLIGEALSSSDSPESKLREFLSVSVTTPKSYRFQ